VNLVPTGTAGRITAHDPPSQQAYHLKNAPVCMVPGKSCHRERSLSRLPELPGRFLHALQNAGTLSASRQLPGVILSCCKQLFFTVLPAYQSR
jgi:hypothetical protein